MTIGYDATSAFCEPKTGNGRYSKILLESLINNPLIKNIKVIYPEKDLSVKLVSHKKIKYAPIKNFGVIDRHKACFNSVKQKSFLKEYSTKNIDFFVGPDFTLPHLNCPFIVTFHDFGFFHYPKMYNKTTVKHLTYICKKEAKIATGILIDSRAMNDEFKQWFPNNKTTTYYIPCVPHKLKLDKKFINRKLPPKYLLTVGDIMPKKNQEILVKALEIIKNKYRLDYKVVIVGIPTVNYSNLYSLIKNLKLENEVLILNNVSDKELAYIYKKSSIYISCSLNEGFGLTPFEATQFNVPIIASDIPASRETLKNGALFFPKNNANALANAIIKITRNHGLRLKLTKAARNRLLYYSTKNLNNKVSKMLIHIKSKLRRTNY